MRILSFIIGLLTVGASILYANGDPIGKKGRTLVVLVGISDYKYVDDLRFAHRDALAFKSFLQSSAGGKVPEMNIVELINEHATAGQFAAGLDWLYDEVGEDDRVIIYFSGHGDVEQKFLTPDAYLLTYESPRFGYHGSAQEVSIIDKYIEYLVVSKQADVTLIADACRAGNLAGATEDGQTQTTLALQRQKGDEIRILSCYPEQFSVEGTEWGDGRGAFSYFLVNGLTGLADRNKDGRIKLLELESFLKDVVPKAVAPKDQVPMIISDNPGQTIALVDSLALSALMKKINSSDSESKGERRDKGLKVHPLDSGEQEIFNRFLILLEEPQGTVGSNDEPVLHTAFEYYMEQVEKQQSTALINLMKRKLVGALLDPPNSLLSDYKMGLSTMMVGSKEVSISNVRSAADYLNKASQVIDPSSFNYNRTKSNQLFFEGLEMRLTGDLKKDASLYSKASQKFDQSISFQTDNAAALNELGISQSRMGDNIGAAKSFKAAINRAPKWLPPHMNLAFTYELLKRSPEALLKYQDVIRVADSPLYDSNSLTEASLQTVREMYEHAQDRIAQLSLENQDSQKQEDKQEPKQEPDVKPNPPKANDMEPKKRSSNSPQTKPGQKKKSGSKGMSYKEWKQFRERASAFNLAGPEAALVSLVAPGAGDYMVRNKVRPYYLLTLADWGLIAGGIYYKRKSNKIYNEQYLTAASEEEAAPFYDEANKHHHRYLVMIGSAIVLTATDVALVSMRGRKNLRKRKGRSVGQKFELYPGFDFSPYTMAEPSYALQFRWTF